MSASTRLEPLVQQAHTAPITEAPDVLQLDGIWLTLQTQRPTIQPDKRHRAPHQRKGERVVVLVAVGFWRDGRREILDWQVARERGAFAVGSPAQSVGATRSACLRRDSKPSYVMGVAGLDRRFELVYGATVIDQRCLFHKLKKVAEACRKELKGDKHKEERKQLLQQASAVYEAESAQQAQEQRAAWAARWRHKAPKSVAPLEREFEATIAYFQLEGLPREWVRTTSLLERVNRQLRRKVRQALSFGSHKGAEVALYLHIQRLHAQWADECWWETAHALYFDLAKDNP